MLIRSVGLALAAILLVAAQSPPDFSVAVDLPLDVTYGSLKIEDGAQYDATEIAQQPNITMPRDLVLTGPTNRSILILMDADAGEGTPRTTFLHWFAANVTGTLGGPLTIPSTGPDSFMYLPPSPPAGDYPHRYIFFLYEQPENFTVPANVAAGATDFGARLGFDLKAFLEEGRITSALGATYMRISNSSAPATTPAPSASGADALATALESHGLQTASTSGAGGSKGYVGALMSVFSAGLLVAVLM